MQREFLGDSYDAVKRLWGDALLSWAPVYAEPIFIPADLRVDFTRMTRIPMLGKDRPAAYSVLNDPDTGIFTPDKAQQRISRSHTSLERIRGQLAETAVRCAITFDQSNHRKAGRSPRDQRNAKMSWLGERSIRAFYYVSHAPFLFACAAEHTLEEVMVILERAGVPRSRMERCK